MKEKNIILVARVLSAVFTPFYLSFVGMTVLFTFSYLSQMPCISSPYSCPPCS